MIAKTKTRNSRIHARREQPVHELSLKSCDAAGIDLHIIIGEKDHRISLPLEVAEELQKDLEWAIPAHVELKNEEKA